MDTTNTANGVKVLDRYLLPIDVWAIAFGCMVSWGVFAMPGTTFLPKAGPAGTVIAMTIGMIIMLVIGNNFSYLMGRTSMTGGVYTCTKEAFGRDHAFLSSWFLCLSYLTIVFLNGTALFFVVRILFGSIVHRGTYYTVAGNTVYLSEALVSVLVLAGIGLLFVAAKAFLALRDPAKANVPIVAMTANAFKEDEMAAYQAGMQAHIAKPIDVDVMMSTLTHVLKNAETADGNPDQI